MFTSDKSPQLLLYASGYWLRPEKHLRCQKARCASVIVLTLLAFLSGCGPGEHEMGAMVPVNLSLVVDDEEASREGELPLVIATLKRWFFDVTAASAQVLSDIATIQVEISAPDLSIPVIATIPVTNPTSGQVIPVSIQVPSGYNRSLAVAALNAAGRKLYSGSAIGVTLLSGEPSTLEIRLVRAITVTVQRQGTGSGTVTSTPAGIECGSTCSAPFDAGTFVVLTAVPDPGASFAGWTGAGCTGTMSCTVHTNATVVAVFLR
jgi:hypothetical protein